ncbi:MAG TPA: hypothetical protein VFV17_09295, partial [Usitatibacteraceae bacterium]|nr:hypothetical protein [Usitatibacteraceae bacterium]
TEVYDKRRALMQDDHLVVVRGKVSHDEFSGGNRVTAEDIYDLDTARRLFAKRVELTVNGSGDSARLKQALTPHLARDLPGGVPVLIHYANDKARVDVQLPEAWRVRVTELLVEDLQAWLSADNVKVIYDAPPTTAVAPPRYGNRNGNRAALADEAY